MSNANRRSACPSLSQPMSTGDGLLVRLVLDTPEMLIDQLEALLQAADRHGNGLVEITSRGNLQIRGLTDQSAEYLADEVSKLDFGHEDIPTTMSALVGVDGEEIADPRPLARLIRCTIGGELRGKLAPKVSIVMDSGGQLPVDGIAGDIRLTARQDGDCATWLISIGGNATDAKPVICASEQDTPGVVVELLERTARKGTNSRCRDLTESDIADLTDPSVEQSRTNSRTVSSPPIGDFALADGSIALGIGLPFGAAHAGNLLKLINHARNFGVVTIRLAPGRALMFVGLAQKDADALVGAADKLGFVTRPKDPSLFVSACAGAPLCGSGNIETRALGAKTCRDAAALLDGSFTLHLSGCEKRCADVVGPQLTVLGQPDQCSIQTEVEGVQHLVGKVDSADVEVVFCRLSKQYLSEQKKHRSVRDFLQRLSRQSFDTTEQLEKC